MEESIGHKDSSDGPGLGGEAPMVSNALAPYPSKSTKSLDWGGPEITLAHGGGFGADGNTVQVDPRAPGKENGIAEDR